MLNWNQITGCNTFLGPEAVILTMLLVRIPVSREKWDLGNCQSRFSLTAISVSRQVSSALRTEMLKQVQHDELLCFCFRVFNLQLGTDILLLLTRYHQLRTSSFILASWNSQLTTDLRSGFWNKFRLRIAEVFTLQLSFIQTVSFWPMVDCQDSGFASRLDTLFLIWRCKPADF